ncbi:MAG: tetratricopeptide repeat protein [Lachnospiraceae bacterium]|nr:tetratricopeptide repeat protein [Lachnospiraceae bacterium]
MREYLFKITLLLSAVIMLFTGCASNKMYTLRDEAIEKYKSGSYAEARELFEEALSEGNGQVSEVQYDILRYRAECELRLKDYEAAKKTYGILLKLDPSDKNRELYYDLEEQFERVEEINRAFEVMASGDYEAAYKEMDKYASLGGDSSAALAWFNKAVCAEYLGNWEEAASLLKDYLAVYPDDEAARKEYNFAKTR